MIGVLLAALVSACSSKAPGPLPQLELRESGRVALPGVGWPDFVAASSGGRYLVGRRAELQWIQDLGGRVELLARWELSEPAVAAVFTPGGEAVLLGADGSLFRTDLQGSVRRVARLSSFAAAGELAVSGDRLYLLLGTDGVEAARDGAALAELSPRGELLGRWGRRPVDALLQQSLDGGGLAVCGDGSVYFSYVNSPQLWRLVSSDAPGEREVEVLGPAPGFTTVPRRAIRREHREARRSGSVRELVSLGRSASRVIGLECSGSNRLVRQVARPNGGGSYLEVWDTGTSELLGVVPEPQGILMDVEGDDLVLAELGDSGDLLLRRARWSRRHGVG